MPAIRAIVFDLDDTLYAERDYVFSGYRAALAAVAGELAAEPTVLHRLHQLYESPYRARVFDKLLEELNIDPGRCPGLVERMVHAYRDHAPAIQLLPDAAAALSTWRPQVKLGVISDGDLAMQRRKIEALNLSSLVDGIVLTDAWGREFWKPHPRAYEKLASDFDAAHHQCVFVGDNAAKDFVAPNRLGWLTIHVVRAQGVYRQAPAPQGGAASKVIDSLDALPYVLDERSPASS